MCLLRRMETEGPVGKGRRSLLVSLKREEVKYFVHEIEP